MKIYDESYHIAGIAVGDGFTDPISTANYSHFVYQLGLVDTNTFNEMKDLEDACRTAFSEGRILDAVMVYTNIHNLNCGLPVFCSSMSVRFLSLQFHEGGRSLGKN